MTPLPTARRPLAAPTKAFLAFLQKHPDLRQRIAAAPGRTVAYAGDFTDGAAWQRLQRRQIGAPGTNDFQMLPDVLRAIPCPPGLYAAVSLVTPPGVRTMYEYVGFLTGDKGLGYVAQVPWSDDGFIVWRALSGIFMSNARGRVRIMLGDVAAPGEKVFFRTEVFVLDRNPNIDMFSREAIGALRTRIKSGALPGKIELM